MEDELQMKTRLLEEDVLRVASPRREPLWTKILSGSLTLLAGSGLVGVMNLVYNLAIARLLRTSGFGNATRGLHASDADVGGHTFFSDRVRQAGSRPRFRRPKKPRFTPDCTARVDVRHRVACF